MANIRNATPDDLDCIHKWLSEEQKVHDVHVSKKFTGDVPWKGFLCEFKDIEGYYKRNELQVLFEPNSSQAIAFLCASSSSMMQVVFLEVHPDHRGKGYARQLAEHLIMQAWEKDICVVTLVCRPIDSAPFWQRMGYKLYKDAFGDLCNSQRQDYAYQILRKKNDIITGTKTARIDIRFSDGDGNPLNDYLIEGQCDKNMVYLPERAVGFNPWTGDTCVTIKVDGNELYSGKTQRSAAKNYGVVYLGCEVAYIDVVRLKNGVPSAGY